jgi:hypothetical protein
VVVAIAVVLTAPPLPRRVHMEVCCPTVPAQHLRQLVLLLELQWELGSLSWNPHNAHSLALPHSQPTRVSFVQLTLRLAMAQAIGACCKPPSASSSARVVFSGQRSHLEAGEVEEVAQRAHAPVADVRLCHNRLQQLPALLCSP